MSVQEQIDKTTQYFDYLNEHRQNVIRAWEEMKRKCPGILKLLDEHQICEMKYRVECHDGSKFQEDEFHPYRKHFYPTSDESPDDEAYEKAWQLHLSRNDHHWQYWTVHDYPNDVYTKLLAYLEMICDWQAMGYKFGDNAYEYYNSHKDKIVIDPNWVELVESILVMMNSEE